jgi:phospholipase/lecithinase/hemolysin
MRILAVLMAVMTMVAGPVAAAPNLYVFGDSYSDSGAGYLDGNGPTAVVYMARDLGLPLTFFGDADSSGKGLNFAVSGAQTGLGEGQVHPALPGAPANRRGRGMLTQLQDFEGLRASGRVKIDAGTLVFIAGGLNDRHLATETTVANLESLIRQLYADGGRNFAIALLPERIPQFAEVGQRLNPAIAKIPGELAPSLPGAHIVLSHWGAFFDDVITRPAAYGITNVHDRCAGRATFGEDATPCATPDTYFFYHEGHPSTAVHRIVGHRLAGEIRAGFPGLMPAQPHSVSQ